MHWYKELLASLKGSAAYSQRKSKKHCAPANCSRAAVGSLPGDSTKMRGVVALLSA